MSAGLPGHDPEPCATRYCVADEATWKKGSCPVCDGPGELSEFTTPAGWPLLTLPRDWEPVVHRSRLRR